MIGVRHCIRSPAHLDAAINLFADDAVGVNVMTGQLTVFVKRISGDQVTDFAEWDDHYFLQDDIDVTA